MTQALQTTREQEKRDIRTFLQSEKTRQQIALALPKHLTPERMTRVALTTICRVPKLLNCTTESLLSCLMQCSQLGLEPDGRRAHLIPFENKNKKITECTLIIDWKGLAELALRSGMIAKLHADLICENDGFEFDMGDILHHKINFRESRGEPYAAYAMAVTKTGEKFVQVMTREEIEGIRDNSQGWRAFKAGFAHSSPWQDHPGEMWKKTVFRRLAKWLPLSPEFRDALDKDDELPEVTVAPPGPTKPLFALPEPPEAPPELEPPSNDGDLGPQQTQTAPAPEDKPAGTVNYPRAIRALCKLAHLKETELLDWAHHTGKLEETFDLEEAAMVKPSQLMWLHDNWSAVEKEIKAAKGAK